MAEKFLAKTSADDEANLDRLFSSYRAACPEPEAGANFMPNLWARIEGRQTFAFTFGRLGRAMAAASAVLCLLLAMLNLAATPPVPSSYADALVSEYSAEQIYYPGVMRGAPASGVHAGEGARR